MKVERDSRSSSFTHGILFLIGLIVFALYVFITEMNWRTELVEQAERHARVVSPAIWNLDPQLLTDYLELAAVAAGYEVLRRGRRGRRFSIVWRGRRLKVGIKCGRRSASCLVSV